MNAGNLCTVHVTASDSDGDQLSYAYSAVGGTVDASSSTATSATFSGTSHGMATITVTASDGHGGHTSATAAVYLLRLGTPSLASIQYTCSWTATASESLIITAATLVGYGAFESHYATVNGSVPPVLVMPGIRFNLEDVDPCTASLHYADIRVQRPLPDGRSYDIILN
jgi:hypothetical protein